MEHASYALIVITLLQLCRAEISEIIPGTWFSANAINDGYSPKPILELFSTEPTPGFSPTKPIVVLPSQPPSDPDVEVTYLSTSSPTYIPTSTSRPPTTTAQSSYSTSFSSSSSQFPSSRSRTTTSGFTLETSSTPFPPTTTAFTQSSSYLPPSVSFSPESETVSTPYPPPENFPIFNFPNSPQPQTTLSESPREGRTQLPGSFDLANAVPIPTVPPFQFPLTQTTAPPNYFVVYQNAPQAPQLPALQPKTPVTTSSTFVTTASDTITPFNTNTFSDGTSRPTITFRSTPPTITPFTNPKRTTLITTSSITSLDPKVTVRPKATSPIPPRVYPGPPKTPFQPHLKIRVVAPKGSITNVKINPTTTTKRPPTRKVKVRKNTHEGCVENCKGKREPICAIPLGSLIVDPNLLKGFPSICHMACHNSFKKDPYEMIVDGRCGKLRTRIIKVDTNTKIHREELKKAEYSIVNTGPKTVVEFAGANLQKH